MLRMDTRAIRDMVNTNGQTASVWIAQLAALYCIDHPEVFEYVKPEVTEVAKPEPVGTTTQERRANLVKQGEERVAASQVHETPLQLKQRLKREAMVQRATG
jgi:hypothetical protein